MDQRKQSSPEGATVQKYHDIIRPEYLENGTLLFYHPRHGNGKIYRGCPFRVCSNILSFDKLCQHIQEDHLTKADQPTTLPSQSIQLPDLHTLWMSSKSKDDYSILHENSESDKMASSADRPFAKNFVCGQCPEPKSYAEFPEFVKHQKKSRTHKL